MRDARLQERPRILDFSSRINDVGATRDLAWPCHAYRVMVPIRPTSRLNIFEETVLRLIANARLSERTLAEKTCLDESLIRLACCRLRDLGMLTDHNEIGPLGKAHLSQAEEDAFDYEVRIVFRERMSGRLLPTVFDGELRYEELEEWNGQERSAKIVKSDHKPYRNFVSLRVLRPQERGGPRRPPTPAEVLAATNRHRELSRQFSVLRVGVAPCPPIASGRQLNVDPNPEPVFLRCRLVMPTAGDDYRIGDPFGYGYSESLLRVYEDLRSKDEEEQKYIREWLARSSTVRPRSPTSDPKEADAVAAVLSRLTDAVRGYSELFAKLRRMEKEFAKSNSPARNSAEEADRAYHGELAVQSLADALEAALAQVMAQSQPAASEELLRSNIQTFQGNADLLEKLAEKLGLTTTNLGGLLGVAPGRIRGLRDGSLDLPALLAVTIAAATEAPEHPLRRLATNFPNWLAFLSALKRTRDAGAHGDSVAARSKLVSELREGVYRSIELLLPKVRRTVEGSGPGPASASIQRDKDERRKAKSRLEDFFGVRWYAGLESGMVERLIQVELATWALQRTAEPVEVGQTIKDLASILQAFLQVRQPDAEMAFGDGKFLREAAERRALQTGLLPEGASLPDGLATVNRKRLDAALRGQSPTLGANVMALLLLAPEETLQGFALAFPNLLELCARVIDLRGHGNTPVFLRADEVLALKNEVYKACNVLMEA